ncbi:MAG: sialidase family protein [Kiritimatiellia bacterium]|jgi:hypothetical protein
MKNITPYILHETLIEDHRTDGWRSGEGCVAPLANGDLLMVYARFQGNSDEAPATLVERRSRDDGRNWSKPRVFIPTPPRVFNLMSVSLLPLQDGRMAGLFLRKKSLEDCRPFFMTATGNARRWTTPKPMVKRPGYYVVVNDRMIQLRSGRILAPYAFYGKSASDDKPGVCGCMISDDAGATWRLSAQEIRIEPANVRRPQLVDKLYPTEWRHVRNRQVLCHEPGVVELGDGRVMMWCRSNGGYAYRSFTSDGGENWSPFKAIPEFAMPNSPQSIKRLPGSNRLIMLFNDRTGIPMGHPQWSWRRPLAIAVSDDHGATWQRHGLLEPASIPSNCYYSICFHRAQVVFTYYEGVMCCSPEGIYRPRNLASCKLKIVRRKYFEL